VCVRERGGERERERERRRDKEREEREGEEEVEGENTYILYIHFTTYISSTQLHSLTHSLTPITFHIYIQRDS
jgi:hypothetical protein